MPKLTKSGSAARKTAGPASRNEAAAENTQLRLGPMAKFVGYYLRIAQITFFRDFETGLSEHGVSPGRFAVLTLIEHNPGLTQTRLAEAIRLDRSSMVPMLDALEREGFVERRASPRDRRSYAVWITPGGKQLLARITPLVAEHERRMTRGLSNSEATTLIETLERLERNGA